MNLAVLKKVKIHLPVDFVIADKIMEGVTTTIVDAQSGIPSDKMVKKIVYNN